ncbi:MAG: NAD(P)/FAD-dependent oxidoreductase [Thermoprotei archaeon]|nr:NAD(P)/FAD-dependent oxidoreductase [Thermoprotei archaeon]
MYREVVVIGGGPSGLITARELALRDIDVVVFEEHDEIGVPPHCAGLVSTNCLKELKVPETSSIVLNKVYGIKLVLPSGDAIMFKTKRPLGIVLDRIKFDQEIAKQALQAGSEVLKGHRVLDISVRKNYVKAIVMDRNNKEEKVVKAKYVVCAEGLLRSITKSVIRISKEALLGVQEEYEIEGITDEEKNHVRVFLGSRFSRGLFGWLIPTGTGVRIGLATRGDPNRRMSSLKRTDTIRKLLRKGKLLRRMGGLVNTQGVLERFSDVSDKVFLVGDSAGQNKPLTGGGIYYGGIGAIILAEEIAKGDNIGINYKKRWNKLFGKEIKYMLIARRILDELNDHEVDVLFKTLFAKEEYLDELSEYYDFHYNLASRILSRRLFKMIELIIKINPLRLVKLLI